MSSRSLLSALTALVVATPAFAAEANSVAVPDALKPWVPWVLAGSERDRCPQRSDGARICESYGRLELVVDKNGGSFTLGVRVDAAGLVAIAGDAKHWPLDVVVDGKPAVVAEVNAAPHVELAVGEHTVKGRFDWDSKPESVAIPGATAAVRLVVDGKEVPFVDRGDGGDRVWVKRESAGEEREEDRLDVAVFRKITDGVPLVVETQVLLEVSGKGREVSLPGVLLDGFTPLSLSGSLPVRIDAANALKVQVRPGKHSLTLTERRDVDDKVVQAPAQMSGDEEVWVFEANHAVRIANVTGVPSIVAEQTRLPDAWRAFPAYRVGPGEKITLDQQRRGDESPPPSQLTLMRTLWLDFDGHGYTVHDEIGGRFTGVGGGAGTSTRRLMMGAGTTLGRVSTGDGSGDAFITRDPSQKDASGVEIRSPNLRVSADSRIDKGGDFPAVSWAHDFQSVTERLHLPPGWTLLHAGGVDEVDATWVKSWTLFELFLVVVITLAMGRLWGPLVGAVAAVTMVVTFQEDMAPRGLWVTVVVLGALHRVLPPAWETKTVARLLKIARFCTAVIVALVAIAFSVHQVRTGMYPVLAQEYRRVGDGGVGGPGAYLANGDMGGLGNDDGNGILQLAATKAEPPADVNAPAKPGGNDQWKNAEESEPAQQAAQQLANSLNMRSNGFSNASVDLDGKLDESSAYGRKVVMKRQKLQQIDTSSVVQTGPGLPQWGFTSVNLRFTGPVTHDQKISLVLLSPKVNLALAFLRVLLVAFLVVVAFGFPGRSWPTSILKAFRGKGALFSGAVAVAAVTALLGGSAAHAQPATPTPPSPPADVLAELKARLLQPPACAPNCASIARVSLEADAARLRLRAEVHAQAATAVPLPGADKQWSASTIVVDGKPSAGAVRDNAALWIVLSPGRHDVVVEGALPGRDSVQLTFPLVPHHATFASSSWSLDGIHEDGVPDANLQLNRRDKGDSAAGAGVDGGGGGSGEAPVLPPYLNVQRSLLLGLSFEVETRVTRLSPPGAAVVLEVPLLPGENVTTEGVRVEGKKALVSLGPNDVEVSWSGVIATTDKVDLVAEKGVPFSETWSLEASPVWHVEETGIPPLHDETPREGGARAWRPWPGEKLSLVVTRPEGVPGQTVTIERTSQSVRPGLRSTDVTLTLDMRASRGGEHKVTIPAGAELLSATVNGAQQPLRPANGVVTVPLVPGKQQVVLSTRVPTGVSLLFHPPRFDIAQKSVNAEILVEVPSDRWVLFATGPRAGPAVLFWSFIVILILTGIALGKVPFSPLKHWQWVLLGLGLTQVPLAVAALVAGWLLALGWRKEPFDMHPALFNMRQIVLVCWTIAALIGLVASIHEGLLGAPDMQIAGNGSSRTELRWFADHADALLPSSTMVSAPMIAYRLSMLAWALWLAFSLLKWLRTGWAAFAEGGMWKVLPKPPPRPPRPGQPGHVPPGAVPTAADVPGAPTSAAVPSTSPVPPSPSPSSPSSSSPSSDKKP